MNKKNVCIVGGGELGQAVKFVLSSKNIDIVLWDKNPDKCSIGGTLLNAVINADFVFLCIPSSAVHDVVSEISNNLRPRAIVVSLVKGMDIANATMMNEILDNCLDNKVACGLLSGPMLAEELSAGMIGAGVFASGEKEIFKCVEKLFADSNLVIEYSEDVKGVAVSGVLKNIYAISLGIAGGLCLGKNFNGILMDAIIKEVMDITEILGGKKETALSLAGLGDLVATGFSNDSSNCQVGKKIARGDVEDLHSEGVRSLPVVIKLLNNRVTNFLVLQALEDIIIKNKDAKTIFTKDIFKK